MTWHSHARGDCHAGVAQSRRRSMIYICLGDMLHGKRSALHDAALLGHHHAELHKGEVPPPARGQSPTSSIFTLPATCPWRAVNLSGLRQASRRKRGALPCGTSAAESDKLVPIFFPALAPAYHNSRVRRLSFPCRHIIYLAAVCKQANIGVARDPRPLLLQCLQRCVNGFRALWAAPLKNSLVHATRLASWAGRRA